MSPEKRPRQGASQGLRIDLKLHIIKRGDMNKLLVASEYTDPCFHIHDVKWHLRHEAELGNECGLLLITKEPSCALPIIEEADEHGFPVMVHATITGLGRTPLEPNVIAYGTAIVRLANLVYGYKPERVILRVDPIIPDVTDYKIVREIVSSASKLGITRCRVSVIDYYPFVRKKMQDAGYPVCPSFQAPREVIQEHLQRMYDLCEKYEMTLELCAERFEGALHRGCACSHDWADLGLKLPLAESRQRKECFCNITKYDLLKGKGCRHGCLYCYWGKYRC